MSAEVKKLDRTPTAPVPGPCPSLVPIGQASPAATAPAPAPRRRRRIALIAALPLALAIVGGYFWLTSGRYVSTDDAYVQQDKVTIVPEVDRPHRRGRRRREPACRSRAISSSGSTMPAYQVSVHEAEAAVASARLDVERLKAAYAKARLRPTGGGAGADLRAGRLSTASRRCRSAASSRNRRSTRRGSNLQQAEAAVDVAEQAVLRAKSRRSPAIRTSPPTTIRRCCEAARQAREGAPRPRPHARRRRRPPASSARPTACRSASTSTPGTAVLSLVETERELDRGELQGDRPHAPARRPAGRRSRSTPIRASRSRAASKASAPATGAEFSLLPAQNATGNWVKVVQRIPVRIVLDPPTDLPALRTGMSASVSVDTGRGGLSASCRRTAAPGEPTLSH